MGWLPRSQGWPLMDVHRFCTSLCTCILRRCLRRIGILLDCVGWGDIIEALDADVGDLEQEAAGGAGHVDGGAPGGVVLHAVELVHAGGIGVYAFAVEFVADGLPEVVEFLAIVVVRVGNYPPAFYVGFVDGFYHA